MKADLAPSQRRIDYSPLEETIPEDLNLKCNFCAVSFRKIFLYESG